MEMKMLINSWVVEYLQAKTYKRAVLVTRDKLQLIKGLGKLSAKQDFEKC